MESGRYLHKFLEEIIGNYYDLSNKSTNWNRIKTYMGRINDTLPTYYDLESCKTLVKNYFNGLFSLCYTQPSIEESVEPTVEQVEEIIPVIPVENVEIPTEIKEEEIINNNDGINGMNLLSDLEGLEEGSDEWWKALSK